jgi:hypothetical protein
MFGRYYTRYRESEAHRRRLERRLEDRLLAQADGGGSRDSNTYQDELRHIQSVARELASSITQSQYRRTADAARNDAVAPPRINPIDQQQRPPALEESEMQVNIACKICNEQRIDTLLEPCMHACVCRWCSDILMQQARQERRRHGSGLEPAEVRMSRGQWRCPICRHNVTGSRKFYLG